jgi:hypothetical protein
LGDPLKGNLLLLYKPAITIALGAGAEANDPDPHRHGTVIAHSMEEAEDPNPQDTHTTMKTMK